MKTINFSAKRTANKLRSYLSKPGNVLLLIFAVVLLLLTVYPIYALLSSSVQMSAMESLMYNQLFGDNLKKGDLSFYNYSMLLFGKYTKEYSVSFFWKPLWNSLRLSVYSSLIAVLFGGTVAWLI